MMRSWLLIALCLGLAAGALAQDPLASSYNQGNEQYRQGQYQAAREQYLQVVEAGGHDPQVYYNLGNACFKAGHLGEAVLWYERALRLDPRDVDTRANLRFVRQLMRDKVSEPTGVGQWLADLYFFPTLNELCLGFSLFFLGACALGQWQWWQRSWGQWWRLGLLIASSCLALGTGVFLGARIYGQSQAQVVVLAAEATAHSAPDPNQTAVFVVHEGTSLLLARQEGDWLLVRLPTGLGGWLPASAVGVL